MSKTLTSEFITPSGVEVPDVEDVYDFHESTKVSPHTEVARNIMVGTYMLSQRGVVEISKNRKRYIGLPQIELPEPANIESPLSDIFKNRVSVRSYQAETMSLQQLSSLLGSLRVTRNGAPGAFPDVELAFRSYPSAGNLFPVETYLIPLNVEGVQPTVCHYDPYDHVLEKLHDVELDKDIKKAIPDCDDYLENASLLFIFTMIPQRSIVKYERLGYRFALLEAGIVSQQLTLAAGGLGLGSLHWGTYYDDLVNDLLGVDGVEETLAHALWVGTPASSQ